MPGSHRDEIGASPTPTHLQRRRKTDRESGDWMRVRWSMVWQVVGYVMGFIVLYNSMTNRITRVETRVENISTDISEMKTDVKALLRVVK